MHPNESLRSLTFVVAAILLSFERIAYVWTWQHPESFRAFCSRLTNGQMPDPVVVLERLFYGFKALQIVTFLGWCYVFGNGSLWWPDKSIVALVLGVGLIVAGQILNVGVFYRLGSIGVFYGNRFGYDLAWCEEFPFSLLDHPQYVGALLSIWGFFIAMRFPFSDWYLIPALETVYHALGAFLEQEQVTASASR
jgi:methylene-fatty-acyl-phospholipid synthase